MVIDPGGHRRQRVTVIADQRPAGGIQNDREGTGIGAVRDGVHDAVRQKGIAAGGIPDAQDGFFREILQNQMLQADLTSEGVSVRAFVTMQDDGIMAPDGRDNGFKHERFPLSGY